MMMAPMGSEDSGGISPGHITGSLLTSIHADNPASNKLIKKGHDLAEVRAFLVFYQSCMVIVRFSGH